MCAVTLHGVLYPCQLGLTRDQLALRLLASTLAGQEAAQAQVGLLGHRQPAPDALPAAR